MLRGMPRKVWSAGAKHLVATRAHRARQATTTPSRWVGVLFRRHAGGVEHEHNGVSLTRHGYPASPASPAKPRAGQLQSESHSELVVASSAAFPSRNVGGLMVELL